MNRRSFTRAALTSGAVTALSYSRIVGANERKRVGLIGAGDRGLQIWKYFLA